MKKPLSYPLVNRDQYTPDTKTQLGLRLTWEKYVEYQPNGIHVHWNGIHSFTSSEYTIDMNKKKVIINIKI